MGLVFQANFPCLGVYMCWARTFHNLVYRDIASLFYTIIIGTRMLGCPVPCLSFLRHQLGSGWKCHELTALDRFFEFVSEWTCHHWRFLVRNIGEQIRHALAIVRSADGLRKHHRHINALQKRIKNVTMINVSNKLQHHRWYTSLGCVPLTCIFGQSFMCPSWGMVLVTTTASKQASFIREMAGPLKIPCVSIAYTLVAPASTSLSAAWQIVPHVSAISSTRMATRSFTSPTNTIDATSFAFLRSLWIKANSTFSRSAIEVTRFAPPASGDTMIEFRHSAIFSRIHFSTAGSAYRLSTGMSKKPWKEQDR